MKLFRIMMLLLVATFVTTLASGQANAFINVLTQNSGQVGLGGTVFIQVDVGNTGPVSNIGVNKVRAQISVPSAIVSVLPNAQQTGLPPGWIITANSGSAITVCNGSDVIAVGTQRTVLIAVQGNALGGPSTVAGVLSFGPGTGVCTGPGSLAGDNTADNTSTSSIQVIPAPACSLGVTASAGTITCNGGTTTLTATASGASGAVEYSLNGGPFQSSNTFTVGAAGSPYTVVAREVANTSCSATSSAVTVTQPAAISASASAGAAILCNGGTTTLTITATGGNGTLEYSLNGGAFQSGNSFIVNAGTHSVTVRDANGCTTTTNSVTITQPTALIPSSNAPPIGLPGGSTTVTVSATGGTAPYTGTGTFTRTAGTYTFTVTDANGCTATTTITLTDPAPGQANAFINVLTLNSGQVNVGQTVDIQVSVGNTGPSFIGVNKVRAQISIPIAIAAALPNAQQTGLPAGWIITANTGGSITICNGSDQIPAGEQRQILIKVQGNAAGGPSTVAGVLSFGPGTGVCTGPGSLPGDNTADNTSTSTIQVISTCSIGVTASAGTIACNGGTTTLTATATGGSGTLEYSLNGGAFQAGNTFTVGAGTYTVTAREVATPACTATSSSVIVSQPAAINASASAGVIACNGGSTTLTVTATGGTGAFEYSLNGGAFQAGNTFSVNAAGSPYTVTVRDANGCTATTNSVTVSQPAALTATASATPVTTVGGTDGTATATPSGGTAPYTYSWNSTPVQTTATATGLTAGSYTVTVTDAGGCTTTATTTVGSPSCNLTASAVAGAAILCNGGTTTITVTATGGTAPFQYSLDGGAFQSGNVLTASAGTHTVTVRDASNCTATTNSVTITQPTALVATSNAAPIALPGGSTTVTVGANGGTAPYTGTGTFTRTAGTYTFTVTDANGCTATTTITLTDPTPGQANAFINVLTLNSGQVNVGQVVDVQVSVGNTGPSFIGVNKVRAQISIPIAIATALPNAQQTGLPAGWIITANTGGSITICNGSDQIPAGSQRQILIKVQGTAAGGPSTVAGVLSFGPGTGVCTGPGSLPGDNTADNTSTSTIQVISTCNLTASASAGTIACNGGTTTLTATATGGSGTLEYSLNGGAFQSGNTFTVGAGIHTVTVREVSTPACTATTSSVTVTEPAAINASASAGVIACNGGSTTLTVTATGGTGALEYSLNGGAFQAGNTFSVNAAGSPYTVSVRDANGCTSASNSVTVTEPAAISASAAAGTIACNGGTTTLTVTATGGTGALEYSLNGGAFQSGNTFTVNAAGSPYTVTVRDANACTATTNSVSVTEPPAMAGPIVGAITQPSCGAPTGSVELSGLPAGNWTITRSPGGVTTNGTGASTTISGLTPGTYTFTVTNDAGCVSAASANVVINPVPADNINPTIIAPASISVNTNEGCTATGVVLGTPVTSDNCGVASVTNDAPAAFPLGTTTVTWTVTDASGNTATATQTVTVTDNVKPVILFAGSSLTLPGTTGASSSQSPYLLPTLPGVKFTSLVSVNDAIGGYRMAGLADGLGAYDNNDGTFTVLMNHEMGSTLGIVRAHGSKGAFVSKWVINKNTLQVLSGSDLMQQVYLWNNATQSNFATPGTFAFNRFCSADLPASSAFYNPATGLGTQARIFMNGEEGGSTGYIVGTVATGPDAGKAYVLGKFNLSTNGSGLTGIAATENTLACPYPQNKTVVVTPSDGGTGIMGNSVSVYVGTKTNTGSEVDKAGLTNGTLKFVNVAGNPTEIVSSSTRATNITSGTAFTLSGTTSTVFSRPEDGAWDPADPSKFYFVTTDQLDQTADGIGSQVGRTRLWRLNFADITNPDLGGTIDLLLDGTEGINMLDNMTADNTGHLLLQEDPGNAAHNGKLWQYTVATDQLVLIGKHDPARFGDLTVTPTAPFNRDEESSGLFDVSSILGPGMFLTTDQGHYAPATNTTEVVEGGQLLVMFNPASISASALNAAPDTVRSCSGSDVNLGTPATADNCSVASVTNDAPAIFPAGTTTVTWTVTDGSGNTATATQVVIVTTVAAPVAGTITQPTCAEATGSVVLTGLPSGNWTITRNPGAVTTTGSGATTTISGLAPGTYTFTVTSAGCTSVASADVVINSVPDAPAAPVVSVTQPTCEAAAGTIIVTSNTAGLTFSLDGAPYAGYPSGGYTVAPGTHTLTAQNADGCTSAATSVTINAQPATPSAPIVGIITHPSCTVATGSVVLNGLPSGNWTINPGNIAGNGASTTISGLVAGTYNFTVTNEAGCGSAASADVVINAQPTAPDAPTADVVHPTCTVATGTITITSSTAGLTFSLDGGAFAAYPAGGYVVTAGSHTLAAQNADGCISAVTNVTVNAQPAGPTMPTVNVVQPTCTVATGTITVTSSTTGLTFSLDGGAFAAYPAGGYTVGAGSHTLAAQNADGCISAVANITVDAQPATPSAPIVGTITQPTCTVATGSVVLNGLPSGNWTITRAPGGVTTTGTGASTTISGLAAGTYTFTVSNAAGCISAASADVVIDAQPAAPSAPIVGVITQPSACAATGSVELNGLPSGNWTLTRNPGAITTTGTGVTTTISGLAPGTYTFTVTSEAGCASAASASVVINAQPAALAVAATSTPSSGAPDGTATATVSGGTPPYAYLWSPGGQTTSTATGLAAGTYTVTVTDANGCTATATTTITAGCGVIASAGPDVEVCNGATVTLTASGTGGSTSNPAGPQPFAEISGSTSDKRIYSGNIDYIAIGNTFSQHEARVNCGKNATSSKTLTLPAGAVVKKAYLYWSGSGSVDNTVKLNGVNVSAENTKTDNISGVGSFFGARKDVTSLVTGSGTYTVSDLTWSNSSSYCNWNGAYGAWGMVVVYQLSSLPAARIHLNSEKFDMTYPAGTYSTTINNVSVPANCNADAKLTIMAFEGDAYKGENLRIAGVLDADSNNFRGQGGPNFDIITRNAPSVASGTTSLTYSIQSYQTNTIYGPAIEALFDYVKVLKYNSCPSGSCNGYKYEWTRNGSVVGTTQSVNVSTAGTYKVKVSDCANCSATDEVVVSASTLAATSVVTMPIACNGGTATITVAATGGTAPYTGTGTFTRPAGTYSFTVKDAKGCSVVTTATVGQPSALAITAAASQIPCGGTVATVVVSASGGTAPYTGTGSFSRPAGTYNFTVTDANGCSKSVTVTVAPASCGPVDPTKCYKLIARHSGKAMTVENSSIANGGNIEQRTYSGGLNQIWKFEEVSNGFFKIMNVNSGKVLDVQGFSTANGANIHQWTYTGGDNQRWSLTPTGSYFVLKAKHSGKAASVEGAFNSNGADVEQRGTGSNTNEQWQIVEVSCPFYTKGMTPSEEIFDAELEVTAMPNPSTTDFTLSIKTADRETPVMIKVMDANGKQISMAQKAASNTIKVGGMQWSAGIYFAEVTQGNQRKVVKLIKTN